MRVSEVTVIGFIALAIVGCDERSDDISTPLAFAIDGDTIRLGGKVHDLMGIDAPEIGQRCENGSRLEPCGESAAFALAKLIALDSPTCNQATGSTAYHCSTSTENLAEILLDQGHVVATPDAPTDYREREQGARDEGLGIWRGAFVRPDGWRAGERLAAEKQDPEDCHILGFQTTSGAKAYITPTHPDYSDLQKSSSEIERRFCSDETARSQGYVWSDTKVSR